MSLIVPLQVACGQFGESIFCILWRCLLIRVWPVRSWVSMLVCLQLSELVILMYLSKGSEGSISLIFLNFGDFVHHFFIIALMSVPCLYISTSL
jgi:hypothetical protein